MLQRGNRVQVPKLIRWQFKLEPDQILKVGVSASSLIAIQERFYATMTKNGRILIPNLTLALLSNQEIDLIHHVLQVTLEPL